MSGNDHPNALRLAESVRKHCGEEAADALTERHSLSKSASAARKFQWAQDICDDLQAHFDAETVRQIRMDCACGPGLSKCKKLKAIFDRCDCPEEFARKVTELNQGYAVEYDGRAFHLVYPECYCPCVSRVEGNLPEAWCDCTLGYTKRMFDFILSCDTRVELVHSVKTGGAECRIRILAPEG